jgi:hypothetical protein
MKTFIFRVKRSWEWQRRKGESEGKVAGSIQPRAREAKIFPVAVTQEDED